MALEGEKKQNGDTQFVLVEGGGLLTSFLTSERTKKLDFVKGPCLDAYLFNHCRRGMRDLGRHSLFFFPAADKSLDDNVFILFSSLIKVICRQKDFPTA